MLGDVYKRQDINTDLCKKSYTVMCLCLFRNLLLLMTMMTMKGDILTRTTTISPGTQKHVQSYYFRQINVIKIMCFFRIVCLCVCLMSPCLHFVLNLWYVQNAAKLFLILRCKLLQICIFSCRYCYEVKLSQTVIDDDVRTESKTYTKFRSAEIMSISSSR